MKKSPVVLAPLPSSSVAWASAGVPWEPLARRRLEPGVPEWRAPAHTYRSQRPVTSSDSSQVCGRPCPQQSSLFRGHAGGPALSVPHPAIRVPRSGHPRRRRAACHRPSFGNPVLQRPRALNVPHVAACCGPRGSRPGRSLHPCSLGSPGPLLEEGAGGSFRGSEPGGTAPLGQVEWRRLAGLGQALCWPNPAPGLPEPGRSCRGQGWGGQPECLRRASRAAEASGSGHLIRPHSKIPFSFPPLILLCVYNQDIDIFFNRQAVNEAIELSHEAKK